MQSCIGEFKASATTNMPKLNNNKTELMPPVSTKTKHLHNLPTSMTTGNSQITFKQSVKNLRFTLDCHLTLNEHFSTIARTYCYELRRLSSIPRFLTNTTTATFISAFALSRIDYCNSLLFGSTHDVASHLQRIQKHAARVILRISKSTNINTHKFTSMASCQSKKHLQNSLFVLPLPQQYCTIICHRYAAEKVITLPQHSLQITHHASSQWTSTH